MSRATLVIHSNHFGDQVFDMEGWTSQITPAGDLRVQAGTMTSYFVHGFWEGYDITEEEDDE